MALEFEVYLYFLGFFFGAFGLGYLWGRFWLGMKQLTDMSM